MKRVTDEFQADCVKLFEESFKIIGETKSAKAGEITKKASAA
jgi:hypothetical protein